MLGWDEDALRRDALAMAALNPELGATYLAPDEVRRLEPGLADGLAAVRFDIGFPVAPASATRALAALARARGAVIREGADATVERRDGAAVGVRVDGRARAGGRRGRRGGTVVAGARRPDRRLAADPPVLGRHRGAGARGRRPAARPRGGGDRGGDRPRCRRARRRGRRRLQPRHGRRTVVAGLHVPPGRAGPARLRGPPPRRAARGTSRRSRRHPREGMRACARPVALDGRPLVGAVPGIDRLFIAAGHGPWGISTGPASARHVAALVLGEDDPRDARRPRGDGRRPLRGAAGLTRARRPCRYRQLSGSSRKNVIIPSSSRNHVHRSRRVGGRAVLDGAGVAQRIARRRRRARPRRHRPRRARGHGRPGRGPSPCSRPSPDASGSIGRRRSPEPRSARASARRLTW